MPPKQSPPVAPQNPMPVSSHVNANIYKTQPPPMTHIDELPDPYYANSQNNS